LVKGIDLFHGGVNVEAMLVFHQVNLMIIVLTSDREIGGVSRRR
jgi:hypothetical protein